MRKITEAEISKIKNDLCREMFNTNYGAENMMGSEKRAVDAAFAYFNPVSTFLPAQMKELREISREHMLWVIAQVTTVEVTSVKFKEKDTIAYTYASARGKGFIEETIDIHSCSYTTIDYLRRFYNIPNLYSLPAAVSAEDFIHKTYGDKDISPIPFKDVVSLMQAYAAHPLSAPKRDEVTVLGEIITGEECIKRGYSNDSIGERIKRNAAYADMAVRSKLLHRLTEIDVNGSFSLPSSVPAIDWQELRDWVYEAQRSGEGWSKVSGMIIEHLQENYTLSLRSDIKKEGDPC